jgi:hypothetical protein
MLPANDSENIGGNRNRGGYPIRAQRHWVTRPGGVPLIRVIGESLPVCRIREKLPNQTDHFKHSA